MRPLEHWAKRKEMSSRIPSALARWTCWWGSGSERPTHCPFCRVPVYSRLRLVCLLILCLPVALPAQGLENAQNSPINEQKPSLSVVLGVGAPLSAFSTEGGFAWGANIEYQNGALVLAARFAESIGINGDVEPNPRVMDFGILGGWCAPVAWPRMSIRGGVAFVQNRARGRLISTSDTRRYYDPVITSTVGLPLELSFLFPFGRTVGLGLRVLDDLNTQISPLSVQLCLAVRLFDI